MTISSMRFLDRWLGVPVCRLLSLFHSLLPGKAPDSNPAPSVVLVIQISEMGSILLSFTMLERLRRRYPEAQLLFLTFERNQTALKILQPIQPDRVIALSDRNLWSFFASAARAVLQMRRHGVDTVLDLEMFSRASAILSLASGAERRVGFERHSMEGLYRGNFLSHPVPYNPYLHIGRNYLALLDSLVQPAGRPLVKLDYSEDTLQVPRVTIEPAVCGRIQQLVERAWGSPDPPGERILLNLSGGALPVRAWPLEHFAALSRRLLERESVRIGVIGLPEDAPLFDQLAEGVHSGRLADFTGQTADIFELIELLNQCQVLVTADSGAAHLAALSGIRSIVLFGPETPLLYAPLGTNSTLLYRPIACSPCLTAFNHRRSPCDGRNLCVEQFTPEQVFEQVAHHLGWRAALQETKAGVS